MSLTHKNQQSLILCYLNVQQLFANAKHILQVSCTVHAVQKATTKLQARINCWLDKKAALSNNMMSLMYVGEGENLDLFWP